MEEHEIQKVMRDLGFDYMQARSHIKCRNILRNSSPSAPVHPTTSLIARVEEDVKRRLQQSDPGVTK